MGNGPEVRGHWLPRETLSLMGGQEWGDRAQVHIQHGGCKVQKWLWWWPLRSRHTCTHTHTHTHTALGLNCASHRALVRRVRGRLLTQWVRPGKHYPACASPLSPAKVASWVGTGRMSETRSSLPPQEVMWQRPLITCGGECCSVWGQFLSHVSWHHPDRPHSVHTATYPYREHCIPA